MRIPCPRPAASQCHGPLRTPGRRSRRGGPPRTADVLLALLPRCGATTSCAAEAGRTRRAWRNCASICLSGPEVSGSRAIGHRASDGGAPAETLGNDSHSRLERGRRFDGPARSIRAPVGHGGGLREQLPRRPEHRSRCSALRRNIATVGGPPVGCGHLAVGAGGLDGGASASGAKPQVHPVAFEGADGSVGGRPSASAVISSSRARSTARVSPRGLLGRGTKACRGPSKTTSPGGGLTSRTVVSSAILPHLSGMLDQTEGLVKVAPVADPIAFYKCPPEGENPREDYSRCAAERGQRRAG